MKHIYSNDTLVLFWRTDSFISLGSLMRFALAITVVGVLTFQPMSTFAQRVRDQSSTGSILPQKERPILEARIIYPGGVLGNLFPGASLELSVLIVNTGKQVAQDCWLKVETDSPFLVAQSSEVDFFSINPGDSVIKSLPVQIRQNASLGTRRLSLFIEEKNGFNLYPPRNVSFTIEPAPEIELVVSDFAIKDQSGVGYFEQFEDVELVFRVQNCSRGVYNDVNAKINLHESIIAKQLNPNYVLGTLGPGEYRDISAVVSTGIAARDISLEVVLNYGAQIHQQPFKLEFRKDYKNPESLLSNACDQYIPSIKKEETDIIDFQILPSKPLADNKYAIIIWNQDYFTLENVSYAKDAAESFVLHLVDHMGYRQENIAMFSNTFHMELVYFENSPKIDNLVRSWRRTRQAKDLVFYYVGYGSVDVFNGDVYLLPINYSNLSSIGRKNIIYFYELMNTWKSQYEFNSVTAVFDIQFIERSLTGNMLEKNFNLVHLHQTFSGFTSFLSSSFNHNAVAQQNPYSVFTKYFMKGLKGAADINQDGSVSASELHQFLSDELIGVPAETWQLFNGFNVPIFLGQNAQLY